MVTAPSISQHRECDFAAGGMTCTSCVRQAERAQTSQDGVVNGSVYAISTLVQVIFGPRKISGNRISKVMNEVGYPVSSLGSS